MGKRIITTEEIIEALISGKAKLRRDIKIKYGKYRIIRMYKPITTEYGSEGKVKAQE